MTVVPVHPVMRNVSSMRQYAQHLPLVIEACGVTGVLKVSARSGSVMDFLPPAQEVDQARVWLEVLTKSLRIGPWPRYCWCRQSGFQGHGHGHGHRLCILATYHKGTHTVTVTMTVVPDDSVKVVTLAMDAMSQCDGHGHGHGHGIFILATHPEGTWSTWANPNPLWHTSSSRCHG